SSRSAFAWLAVLAAVIAGPRGERGPKRASAAGDLGRGARAARDRHRAAAHDRDDAGHPPRPRDEAVDVRPSADELDRDLRPLVIEDADVELPEHLLERARVAVDRELDERELPLDVVNARHVGDVHDVDGLAELLRDLIDDLVRAGRDEREPRYGLVVRRRDVETLDVVAAGRKEVRDA